MPLVRPVDQHGNNEDDAGGKQLVERLHVHQRQPVAQGAKNDAADQRAGNGPPAAHQAGTAGRDSGDCVQFLQGAKVGFGRAQSANQDHLCHRTHQAGHHMGRQLGQGDRLACDACGLGVAANGHEILAKQYFVHDDPGQQGRNGHNDHQVGQAQDKTDRQGTKTVG